MFHLTKTFAEQISAQAYIAGLFYIIACMGAFLVVVALALIDAGTVNAKHLVDTLVQKIVSAFIGGASCMIAGYAIWNWQFNQAFGIPNPLMQSLSDWWLFGPNLNTYSQYLDNAAVPNAETQQIFVVFFFAYAAVIGAFVHSMGLGRMKPSACYILSAVAGGLLMPIMTYLTWGPASPLSNNGLHDFVGSYSLYMFIGVWSLILAWRLGPRLASSHAFDGHLLGSGALVLMVAIPMFVMGCGFLEPGLGYFGISNTTSGLGIVFINVFMAFSAGTLSGAVIAYRKHKPIYVFLGPIAGYISCTALFDIASPWQCFAVAAIGPWVMRGVAALMTKYELDDQKIVPVALGPSILSVLLAGIIGSGIATGGVAGATGDYVLQHAHISIGMQFLGVLVTLAIAGGSGLILVFGLEKTIGLRVASTIEQDGMDVWYWNEWRKSRKMRVSPKAMADYQ
jgi:Amt family ammonium transporter